ncbi:MAG: hypothetical protein QM778_21390 [Myxococcales bacterium]
MKRMGQGKGSCWVAGRGALWALSIVACGDQGNIGNMKEPCIESSCELPKAESLGAANLVATYPMRDLPTLSPTTTWDLGSTDTTEVILTAGANGTVWVVQKQDGQFTFKVRQFDAEKELGSQDIGMPAAKLPCDGKIDDKGSVLSLYGLMGGQDSVFSTRWAWNCVGHADGSGAIWHEFIALGATAQEPATRFFHEFGALSSAQRDPTSSNFMFLGFKAGMIAQRTSADGHASWQQGALGEIPIEGSPNEAIAFLKSSDVLTVVNRKLGTDFLNASPAKDGKPVTLSGDDSTYEWAMQVSDLDWKTGNVLSRGYFGGGASVSLSADSAGRVVVATPDDLVGDIHWMRVNDAGVDEVLLQRVGFTLMTVSKQAPDRVGGSYLITSTGERDAQTATLCRMNDAQQVSCVLVPGIAPYELVAGNDNAVYALTSTHQLARFDFPQ